MRSYSLPLLSNVDKNKQEINNNKNKLKNKINSINDINKITRPLIQFSDRNQGFQSFKNINTSQNNQIVSTLSTLKQRSSGSMNSLVKAQITFNKNQLNRISKYCIQRSINEKNKILLKLSQMKPMQMKKQITKIEKYKKKIKTTTSVKLDINYTIYESNQNDGKPYIDYYAMAVQCNQKVYFTGGRRSAPFCNYDRQNNRWNQGKLLEQMRMFGQSQGTMISTSTAVFFGGTRYSNTGVSLMVTNSIQFINFIEQHVQVINFNDEQIRPRAYHSQCKYGQYLLVGGGIDKNNELINNFMMFHLNKKYWCELTVAKCPKKMQQGFAKNQMIPIFHRRKNYQIYQKTKILCTLEQQENIKQEGIYMFGGEDNNANLCNTLYIIKMGSPSIVVYQPSVAGKPPLERKNFGYAHWRNFLIIHGGRNDEIKPFVLNSIHFLNLKTMNWIKVTGQRPIRRHSHILATYNQQIIILGGLNTQGLCKQVFPMIIEEIVEYI